ncbi:fasciclin-1 [Eurytemora carolleeae]|uniref:fasciclin-1 n=1 Tax=Eurytemora carolleeae TaxID=1294199 RepID=UPI000C79061E|nr:fasciclin-1 [Eurytemora carolleeae]|eukprot:XP_023344668.1 fasciclin-1-like [Eurytemora affinis]
MQILRKLIFLNSFLLLQAENILDFLQSRDDLQQFLLVLQRPGLHKAYLERQITVFVPTDKALLDYRGVRGEDFALNHIVNSVEVESKLGTRLSTLVTGGPPIWVTRRSAWIYFNQARVLEKNIVLNLGGTEQQIVYILDGVLEPLLPISVKNATFTQDVTAGKLLQLSTLYNIGDNLATRIFYQSAVLNKREKMFDVPGRHTFFLPVDQSFQVYSSSIRILVLKYPSRDRELIPW